MSEQELRRGKWTDEETERVKARYAELGSTPEAVETIAKEENRTPRSVQGKLSSEKVYIVPEKKPAAKRDDGPTKGEILTATKGLGFDVDGFDQASKDALKRLNGLVERAKTAGVEF